MRKQTGLTWGEFVFALFLFLLMTLVMPTLDAPRTPALDSKVQVQR